ncbi:MAG: ferritin-like domain-containing protein [Oligoflexales bacterium]
MSLPLSINRPSGGDLVAAATSPLSKHRQSVVSVLTVALATEWISALRYSQHAIAAAEANAPGVSSYFAECAKEEQQQATLLADRIKQLGGNPCLDPAQVHERSRSISTGQKCHDLQSMIRENLSAEQVSMESYLDSMRYIADSDLTTTNLLRHIFLQTEKHAAAMAGLSVSTL